MLRDILVNVIGSFISSVTFGVLINVPRRHRLAGGVIGMLGWMGYWALNYHNGSVFMASVLCALILSVLSHMAARWQKAPTQIFFVPGLVPVVPGIPFFHAFQALISGQGAAASSIFVDTMFTAVGIACGVGLANVALKIYKSFRQVYRQRQA